MYRLQGQVAILDYLIDGRFEGKVLQQYLRQVETPTESYMATDSDGESNGETH